MGSSYKNGVVPTPIRNATHFGVLLAALGMAANLHGQILIANGDNIGLYDSQSGAAINPTFISLDSAAGVAIGPDGNIYAGTPSYSAPLGPAIATFNLSTGAPIGVFASHASDNALNDPASLAFGPGGNLYVSDLLAGNVFVYDPAGNHAATISSPNLFQASGLAFNSSGTLYVADESSANVFQYKNGTLTQVNTDSGVFTSATGVGVGTNGTLYVLDNSAANGAVFTLDPASGSVQKLIDFSTNSFTPNQMVVGPDGNLYLSGMDSSTGDGELRLYSENGTGGNVFADLGLNANPTYFAFAPEPSALSLSLVAGFMFAGFCRRRSTAART